MWKMTFSPAHGLPHTEINMNHTENIKNPTSPHDSKRFLVALSFPGEKRDFVSEVAERLGEALGRERIFYDQWYEAELARTNLDTYLQEFYGEKSYLVVPFFCEDYEQKPWCCKVEWPAIRAALAFGNHSDDYLMAMRFDNAPVKGFLQIHGYIEIEDRHPQAIANLILKRLKQMGHYTPNNKPPEAEPTHAPWFLAHPYMMPDHFTGRREERAALKNWLQKDKKHPLLVLRALGGFGKSALTWHWLMNDVSPNDFTCVVWWSFYGTNVTFDTFLIQTLNHLKKNNTDTQQTSSAEAVEQLLHLLQQSKILLVLDGFERELRAFSGLDAAYQGDHVQGENQDNQEIHTGCISPLAEIFLSKLVTLPNIQAKVLMTTRLCPKVLETKSGGLLLGCTETELKQMDPADAVEFFMAHGINGTHTEIETACTPYGYHPLSLSLLAGLILGDLEQPGDIKVAQQLDVSGDLVQRQHHVLESAYDSLTPVRKKLLSRIACFRSPVEYNALKKFTEDGKIQDLQADLKALKTRGLLYHDTKAGRFDLHPIVRRYAYDRLATPDRADAHTQLRDYFAAVPKPDKITCVEDLAPVIELYHHTVCAGQFDEAQILLRDRLCPNPLYFQLGAYLLIIDLLRALFPDGEDHPPRLKDENNQGWTLNGLANTYSLSGQPHRAVGVFKQANAFAEKEVK